MLFAHAGHFTGSTTVNGLIIILAIIGLYTVARLIVKVYRYIQTPSNDWDNPALRPPKDGFVGDILAEDNFKSID